jgi:hypothetical protein
MRRTCCGSRGLVVGCCWFYLRSRCICQFTADFWASTWKLQLIWFWRTTLVPWMLSWTSQRHSHDSLQCLEPSAQEKLDFYAVAIGFAVLAGIYGGQQTLSNLHTRRGCNTCISSISFNYLYTNIIVMFFRQIGYNLSRPWSIDDGRCWSAECC